MSFQLSLRAYPGSDLVMHSQSLLVGGFQVAPYYVFLMPLSQLQAIPHRAMNADTYKGFHIPANATILGNTWSTCFSYRLYHQRTDNHTSQGNHA